MHLLGDRFHVEYEQLTKPSKGLAGRLKEGAGVILGTSLVADVKGMNALVTIKPTYIF